MEMMANWKYEWNNTLPGRCEREYSSLWRRILSCVDESGSPKLTANQNDKQIMVATKNSGKSKKACSEQQKLV